MGWYALFVETGKEELVKNQINNYMNLSDANISYELLIAKREIQERTNGITTKVLKSMFPGYILLRTEQILDFYLKTKGCYHLLNILRNGSYFKEISLQEISKIIYMADEEGIIGSSDVFIENDRIIVTKGPLMNYDGVIKKVDRRKHRVKVLFLFNGQKHFIDLSANFIEKYNDDGQKNEVLFYKK